MSRSLKPVMASAVLRDSSARSNLFANRNRFNHLSNVSQFDSRARSPSVKRKLNDGSYANVARNSLPYPQSRKNTVPVIACVPPVIISSENLEKLELNAAKVESICEKLHESILAIPEENPVCPILRQFCEIFHIHNENNKIMAEAFRSALASPVMPDAAAAAAAVSDSEMESDSEPASQMVSLGALPKARNSLFAGNRPSRQDRVRASDSRDNSAGDRTGAGRDRNDRSPTPTPSVQRFRDLVKDAEKSTVVFNLDMGRVPLINRETMGIKATAALTAMAAAVENRPANNPSADAIATIDDALSVAEKISFFGKSTKTCNNGKSNGGAFCSIPVCYSFPDRETRTKVEHVIRTTCKASCATPYPQALRECLKVALADGKLARPDDYCSVALDLPKLCLRMSWRAKNTSVWSRYDRPIPIPECVIEAPTIVPQGGIKLENLPTHVIPPMGSSPPRSPPFRLNSTQSSLLAIIPSQSLGAAGGSAVASAP